MDYWKVKQYFVLSVLLLLALFTASNTYAKPLVCNDADRHECLADLSWKTLIQWADDWSNSDVLAYLSHYDPRVSPIEGLARSDWLNKRTKALSQARDISIKLQAIDLQILSGTQSRITVIQRYNADHYSDIVLKTFTFELHEGRVHIFSEVVDRTLSEKEAEIIIKELG